MPWHLAIGSTTSVAGTGPQSYHSPSYRPLLGEPNSISHQAQDACVAHRHVRSSVCTAALKGLVHQIVCSLRED